jgi:hypothetical protein
MQNEKILYIRKATMWNIQDADNNITNTVIIPRTGMIAISSPPTARVSTYVNNSMVPTQEVAVNEGDAVFFRLTNYRPDETPITLNYEDSSSVIMLAGMKNKEDLAVTKMYSSAKLSDKTNLKDNKMAEILQPSGMMMSGAGDGGLGFGSGGGLIGGLILGSLLRNGQGGLFGGDGNGGASAVTGQATANMQLMQSIGQVDKAVAVGQAAMEASQANQSIGLTNQFNSVAGSLATRVDGVKEAVNANAVTLMQQLNQVNTNLLTGFNNTERAITADGTTTRALIVQQYEQNLTRQLTDANAEIIELRGDRRLQDATNGINVTTTNNINQMQQQTQQQQQYGQLANMIWGLGQQIRSTNEAINVGSGTLTANPANTNTNIR